MEILINELSLDGQFSSINDFIEKGLRPFIAVLKDINREANNAHSLHKKQDFWQFKFTSCNTIHDIIKIKNPYENEEIRQFKSLLQQKLFSPPYWDAAPMHSRINRYSHKGNDIKGSSLAEACERDKVVVSFRHDEFREMQLVISKNDIDLELDNLFGEGQFAQLLSQRGIIVNFTLRNHSRFKKTSYITKGNECIYTCLETGHLWYFDNFHKTHYEVFNENGDIHLGEADMDGNLKEGTADNGKSIRDIIR